MTLPEAIVQMKWTNRSTSRTDGASMAKPRTGRRGRFIGKKGLMFILCTGRYVTRLSLNIN